MMAGYDIIMPHDYHVTHARPCRAMTAKLDEGGRRGAVVVVRKRGGACGLAGRRCCIPRRSPSPPPCMQRRFGHAPLLCCPP